MLWLYSPDLYKLVSPQASKAYILNVINMNSSMQQTNKKGKHINKVKGFFKVCSTFYKKNIIRRTDNKKRLQRDKSAQIKNDNNNR